MRFRVSGFLAIMALGLLARPLSAQVGTTTDVLTGIVRDSTGLPVADAVVEAMSIETQVVRTTRTDPRGRYTLLFPDGGGQYRLIVRAIGKTPVMRTIARVADEDRLVTNVTLGVVAARLDEIVVRGRTTGSGGVPSSGGSAPPSAAVSRIMRPAPEVVIELTDTMITIKDGGEIPQRVYLDGRTVKEPALTGPAVELTAKWKDGRLAVDRKAGTTESLKETYSIDKKTNRLIIEIKATSANLQRPLEVKRAYDLVVSP